LCAAFGFFLLPFRPPHVEMDAGGLVSAAVAAFIGKWLCAITFRTDGVSQ
jgi:hypothetical protein